MPGKIVIRPCRIGQCDRKHFAGSGCKVDLRPAAIGAHGHTCCLGIVAYGESFRSVSPSVGISFELIIRTGLGGGHTLVHIRRKDKSTPRIILTSIDRAVAIVRREPDISVGSREKRRCEKELVVIVTQIVGLRIFFCPVNIREGSRILTAHDGNRAENYGFTVDSDHIFTRLE